MLTKTLRVCFCITASACQLSTRNPEKEVRKALNELIPLQEAYKRINGRYANTFSTLVAGGPPGAGGVQIVVQNASSSGWSASASHSAAKGLVCVVYHGNPDVLTALGNAPTPASPDQVECAQSK
jgi:hypothetical protein